GIANLAELRPIGEDGNYVVGFTWTREKAIRVTKNSTTSFGQLLQLRIRKALFGSFRSCERYGTKHQPQCCNWCQPSPFSTQLQQWASHNLSPEPFGESCF